jgi:hypothetical protein
MTRPNKEGFIQSHFGNPERDERYGTDNDYETSDSQYEDTQRTGSQAIWYLGAFAAFMALCYVLFG